MYCIVQFKTYIFVAQKMKKYFKYMLLIITAYYTVGFGMLWVGYIQKFPVFFNTVLKQKGSSLENDNSVSSPDGPFVFYEGNKILVKSIALKNSQNVLSIDTSYEKKKIKLTCSLHDGQSFSFDIRDSLKIDPTEYTVPKQMLVVSDIEGNFYGFASLLKSSGIIDQNYNWMFDKGHLVLVGDFFDRGLYVTETLWLIYKLESEAEMAGGKVHFVLGNHEIMNLNGNLKYLRRKYYKNAEILQEPYKNLYGKNTELGKWLRTKNTIEKIGGIIFVHGGISKALIKAKISLDEINIIARQNIGVPKDLITSEKAQLIFDTKIGPFWYRGLVNEDADQNDVDEILKYYKANRVVVGHTKLEKISTLYNKKVIAIDIDHAENFKKNIMQALWIEKAKFYSIDNKGTKTNIL